MGYEETIEALADATRRRIFERVHRAPVTVGELAAEMPVSQPAVSQHLAVLQRAHLVTWRAEGRRRIYRPDPRGLAALRAYVDRLWDDVLGAYGASFTTNLEASDDFSREEGAGRSGQP